MRTDNKGQEYIYNETYEKDFIYNNCNSIMRCMCYNEQETEWQKEAGEVRADKQGDMQPRFQDKRTNGPSNERYVSYTDSRLQHQG